MEETYSAPRVIELGSVSELTLHVSSNRIADQTIPGGTPIGTPGLTS